MHILVQQQTAGPPFVQQPQGQGSIFMPAISPHPNNQQHIEEKQMEEQIKALRNQIIESESNLKAHEMALNSQKQVGNIFLGNYRSDLGKNRGIVDGTGR